jgi:hypothetical protein
MKDRSLHIERIHGRSAGIALTAVCLAVIAADDGVRTALLVGFAGGAILLTRVRIASYAALAALILATVLVISGYGING